MISVFIFKKVDTLFQNLLLLLITQSFRTNVIYTLIIPIK